MQNECMTLRCKYSNHDSPVQLVQLSPASILIKEIKLLINNLEGFFISNLYLVFQYPEKLKKFNKAYFNLMQFA